MHMRTLYLMLPCRAAGSGVAVAYILSCANAQLIMCFVICQVRVWCWSLRTTYHTGHNLFRLFPIMWGDKNHGILDQLCTVIAEISVRLKLPYRSQTFIYYYFLHSKDDDTAFRIATNFLMLVKMYKAYEIKSRTKISAITVMPP